MKNYVCINGNKIQITDEQAEEITKGLAIRTTVQLSERAVGDTFRIGECEFVVLEHKEEITARYYRSWY